jgi:ATP-binding cassette subfamily B protein
MEVWSMKNKIARFFRFCNYLSDLEHGYFICVIISNILKAIAPFVNLYFSKKIIDAVLVNMSSSEIMKYVWAMVILNLLIMILHGYFESRGEYHNLNMMKKHEMKKAKKLMNLDYEVVENDCLQTSITELYSLEQHGVYSLSNFNKAVADFIASIAGVVIALYFSIKFFEAKLTFKGIYNGEINLIFITLFILLNVISFMIINKTHESAGNFIIKEGNKVLRYIKSYMNIMYNYRVGKDIKMYDINLAENSMKVYKKNMLYVFSSFWTRLEKGNTIAKILSSILSILIFLFVGMKAVYGSISIGQIMLYTVAINSIFKNVSGVVNSLGILIPTDFYRRKLFEFMDIDKRNDCEKSLIKKTQSATYEIEFKDVSFKYPGTDKYVLNDINLKFKEGKRYAVVGINGSGKTTLIKLLLRFYNPTEGQITINGIDIRKYNHDKYLDIFSAVFQDFKLFSLKIGENIASSTEYNEDKVKQSMQKVGLSRFLQKNDLKDYLYREFDENGIEVSGGEAQKIAMARAIYKNGNFIVLDEPTAALDPISEYEIYSQFDNIIGSNTAIYISHRLSSCRFCDNIYVLSKGALVQSGSHSQLISDINGEYYELWNEQAKYYKRE